ncbi:hypothetical protein D039_4430B, partial [Vibrio parahaemolyticus EKP-028]
LSVDLG